MGRRLTSFRTRVHTLPPASLRPSRDHAQRRSGRLHALLLALCALLLPWTAVRAQMDPLVAKKVANLQSKLLARQIKLDEHQDALAAAQDGLLTAQLALTDAESLPEGTPEELVAKTKALKAANK